MSVPFRLLVPLLQPYPQPGNVTRFQIGPNLPNLPTEVPVPKAAILKWSLATLPQHCQLQFKTSREWAADSYIEQLRSAGWQQWRRKEDRSAIVPQGSSISRSFGTAKTSGGIKLRVQSDVCLPSTPTEPQLFRRHGTRTQLVVDSFQPRPGITYITVHVIANLLNSSFAPSNYLPLRLQPVLSLASQPAASTRRQNDNRTSRVQMLLRSVLELSDLATYHATQMQQQGWTPQTHLGNENLQSSLWSRTKDGISQQATVTLFKHVSIGWTVLVLESQVERPSPTLPSTVQPGAIPFETALNILRTEQRIAENERYDLWVNQLPPALPKGLSMPYGAIPLGGLSTKRANMAVLALPLSPDEIRQFYAAALAKSDWYTPTTGFPRTVFDSSAADANQPETYCHPKTGQEIVLTTRPGPDDTTLTHFRHQTSEAFSPCQANLSEIARRLERHYQRWQDIPVPTLSEPPESRVQRSNSGTGNDNFYAEDYIRSPLTSTQLATHYIEQMRQSGWHLVSQGQTNKMAVSLWQMTTAAGQDWQGILKITAQFQPSDWHASFTATTDSMSHSWLDQRAAMPLGTD